MKPLARLSLSLLVVAACKDAGQQPGSSDDAKAKIAQLEASQLALEAFPQWALAHVSKACPDSLRDLGEYVNKPIQSDPWGTPYKMLCGAAAPKEAKGFAVVSFGPDKTEGTADDVTSWQSTGR